jgi:CRISPR system Cascade subunit CasB
MNIDFEPGSDLGKALSGCWGALEENRGARAELRRCRQAIQVFMNPFYQRHLRQWRPYFAGQGHYEDRLAQVIGLLAHVRTVQTSHSIAVQMATGKGGDPAVSELRFRRLIQRERDEYYPAMIRVLRMLRGEANIHSLAESTYFWGDNMRKRWAYDYYAHIPEKTS